MSDLPTEPTTEPAAAAMEASRSAAAFQLPETAGAFEELTLHEEENAIVLSHTREHALVQPIVLGVLTLLFTLFIIVVLPAMNLTTTGNAFWVILGLLILVGIGFATQLPARTTRVRINRLGLEIDQGTLMDREHVMIAWGELAAVELEPVNATDGHKGMQLRLSLREGEPVDTLVNIAVGDLTEARRMILETAHRRREKRAV